MRTITTITLAFGAAAALCAQDTAGIKAEIKAGIKEGIKTEIRTFVQSEIRTAIAGEMVGGKPVIGAPYSAQAVTETTQTLADGNRIVQRSTSTIYRDSQGRERREQTLAIPALLSAPVVPAQTIFISDPVAGVNYSLLPASHIAIKVHAPAIPPMAGTIGAGGDVNFTIAVPAGISGGGILPAGGPQVMLYRNFAPGDSAPAAPKTEQLGNRVIEGVAADGTRTTITIPAGQIGNDQPIQIVSETWRSPELQVIVYSKHSDPRMGETVYSLTNISRVEPSPTLFQVPPDYTVRDAPAMSIQKFEQRIQKQ